MIYGNKLIEMIMMGKEECSQDIQDAMECFDKDDGRDLKEIIEDNLLKFSKNIDIINVKECK